MTHSGMLHLANGSVPLEANSLSRALQLASHPWEVKVVHVLSSWWGSSKTMEPESLDGGLGRQQQHQYHHQQNQQVASPGLIRSGSSKTMESEGRQQKQTQYHHQQQNHQFSSSPPVHGRSSSMGNVKLPQNINLLTEDTRKRTQRVENMPYTDEFQDTGMYTGETNEYGQPHGKGKMKYDNGVFFEGKWTNGKYPDMLLTHMNASCGVYSKYFRFHYSR